MKLNKSFKICCSFSESLGHADFKDIPDSWPYVEMASWPAAYFGRMSEAGVETT